MEFHTFIEEYELKYGKLNSSPISSIHNSIMISRNKEDVITVCINTGETFVVYQIQNERTLENVCQEIIDDRSIESIDLDIQKVDSEIAALELKKAELENQKPK